MRTYEIEMQVLVRDATLWVSGERRLIVRVTVVPLPRPLARRIEQTCDTVDAKDHE